ncbi:MAG: DUF2779 domain-containing protein [Candidatus Izimaplasma sp.]|nr:DUF2779 domain-containing protein [Candidatus Izimaplasma bacterium]
MASMNITKSKFMEYVRCDRYPALNKIHKRKDLDDAENDRFYDLIDSLEGSFALEEDFLEPDTTHLEVMMPYFNEVEILTARKVMSDWGGETRYSTTYGQQKLFLRGYKYYNLMCYVDIYNKIDDQINIVEVKATTTNKFLSMTYKEDGVEYHVFYKDDKDILHLAETREPSRLKSKKYLKKRRYLMERLRAEGVYVFDLAFQRFVIEEDVKDANYYLGVLNHEYRYSGEIIEGKPAYNNDIVAFIDFTVLTKEMQPMIESLVDRVIKRIEEDDPTRVPLGKHCQLKKMRECIYKDVCYDVFPKKNSILEYLSKHHGFKDEFGEKQETFDLINDGFRTMEDVPHEWLTRTNNQIQRDVALTHTPYIDQEKIQDGIKEIRYPIYHLDFESFPCPLPRFEGETPYTQSVFQFSLHIEREAGICDKDNDHYEFLAKDASDHRLELVEAMLKHIKDDGGSVMVYNQAFEKTRIKEFAELFPTYKTELLNLNERLFDLMYLIKTNTKFYQNIGYNKERAKTINYYHEALHGSYSIKKVLPIFSELSYDGMTVGNGMEAVYAYAGYIQLNSAELKETQVALKNYCKQDTWAMVEILNNLRKI